MNLKDFDFKKFMLQNGEWVGLALAVAIAILPLVKGVSKLLGSGSPTANADKINNEGTRVQNLINRATPTEEDKRPPEEVHLQINFDRVNSDKFVPDIPWFVSSQLEDTKRHNPDILPPDNLIAAVVEGGLKHYQIQLRKEGHPQIQTLIEQPKDVGPRQRKREEINQRRLRRQGNLSGPMMPGAGQKGGGGSMPGSMPGGGMMQGGFAGGGRFQGPGGQPQRKETMTATKMVDIDKAEGKHLAENNYPLRMVVVSGEFPYREQLERFRVALRKRTLTELLDMIRTPNEATWEFEGLEIRRRVLLPNGKVKTDWQPYDAAISAQLAYWLVRAVENEPEDEELDKWGLLKDGLMMPRPKLSRALQYVQTQEDRDPEKERLPLLSLYPKEDLKGLQDTLETLKKVYKDEAPRQLTNLERRLQIPGVNVWNFRDPIGNEVKEDTEKPKEPEKKTSEEDNDPTVPDKVLVRFLDPTVEPGNIYEYQVKVKMANPNYHKRNLAYQALGDSKTIVAREWSKPIRVEVPNDIYWYATDEKPDREKLHVQIQRWIDKLLLESGETEIAEWAVLDKAPAYRGEYIGRLANVEVPVWKMHKEDYELAVNKSKEKKVPVDFTVIRKGNDKPDLLVDYEGGANTTVMIGTKRVTGDVPVRALVLTPEGQLIVRNQEEDKGDPERQKREADVKKTIEELKKAKRPGNRAGMGGLFDKGSPLPGGKQ